MFKTSKEKNVEKHKAAYDALGKRISSLEQLEVVLENRIMTAETAVTKARIEALRYVKTDYARLMASKYMLMKRRVTSLRQNYMNIFQTRMQLQQRHDLMPVMIATIESVEDLKAITPPDSVSKLEEAIESAELLNETTKELEYQIQQFAQITAAGVGNDNLSSDDIDRELAELDADNINQQLLNATPAPNNVLPTPASNHTDASAHPHINNYNNNNNNNSGATTALANQYHQSLPAAPSATPSSSTQTTSTGDSKTVDQDGDLLATYAQ
jgi:hypothetical protein